MASINEDHSIDTSHPTLANAPKTKTKLEDDSESLLGIMLKRQRLNSESMGKKQDFSFMPSLTAMTRKDAPLNTSSASNSDLKEMIKRRDLKAADKKFNCQQPRTPTTEPSIPDVIHRRNRISSDKQYQLPKVDIKVPDLLDNNRKLSSMKPSQRDPFSKKMQPENQNNPKSKPAIFNSVTVGMIRSSLSPAKIDHHTSHSFAENVTSKPSGMRDRALQLVQLFGGECLSEKKLSIVKGDEAFKFKCFNGHIFYKFVAELQKMRPLKSRTMSKTTTASSNSSASISSDDESPITTSSSMNGCWCPKCESFYKGAEIIAKSCGFRLCGDLYAN